MLCKEEPGNDNEAGVYMVCLSLTCFSYCNESVQTYHFI